MAEDEDRKRGLLNGLTHYGDPGFAAYLRRSFARSMGYSDEMLGRPIVGITWTASGFNNCHRGVPQLVEAVKRGVLAGGALPLDFPVTSLGEVFLNPTSLLYRNLMAMRHLGGQAGYRAGDRADVDRALPRRATGRLHRLPPLLGAVPRRHGERHGDIGNRG